MSKRQSIYVRLLPLEFLVRLGALTDHRGGIDEMPAECAKRPEYCHWQWCHTTRRVASRASSIRVSHLSGCNAYARSHLCFPPFNELHSFLSFLQKMADSVLLNTAHPAGRTYLAFSRDGSYVLNLHRWTRKPQLTYSQLRVYGRMRLSCSHLEDREWDR